jgi:D-3-phosphoglycerate dehydrogenase
VILTPHIGGSTLEAQAAIGREVATSLVKYLEPGATVGRGELPQPRSRPSRRAPTACSTCTATCPACSATSTASCERPGANIHAQVLATDPTIGYLIMDSARASHVRA